MAGLRCVHVNRAVPEWNSLFVGTHNDALESFTGRQCFDRSNTLPHPANVANVSPLPDFAAPFRKTFAELCDERAVELVRSERELHVFWSGGIDSTVVLVALLKTAPHDQIVVRMTENSIGEFPAFYRKVVATLRHEIVKCITHITLTDQHQYLSGELADQLHGGRPGYRAAFRQRQLDPPPILREYIEPVARQVPRELKTAQDWLWLLQFVFRWQATKVRMMTMVENPSFARLTSFYDTPEFQRWSVLSDERLPPLGPEMQSNMRYKGCAKDYIHKFIPDDHYRAFKNKTGSLRTHRPVEWSHILEDGSVVR